MREDLLRKTHFYHVDSGGWVEEGVRFYKKGV